MILSSIIIIDRIDDIIIDMKRSGPEASGEGEEAGEGPGATEGGRGSKKREQKDRKYRIIH